MVHGSSRLVGPSGFSQDYEQLGNAALAAGDEELALALFATAFRRALAEEDAVKADPTLEIRSPSACTVAIHRVAWKAAELLDDPPRSPLPILGDLIDKRWAEIDDAAAAGELLVAAERAVKFGDVLDDLGELAQAETAYRRAVHFARELDAADPELLLLTFRSLIDFLPPSAETRALAGELVDKLARPKCHHPMRTAEAACCQAKAELSFVAVDPNALDAALDAVANAIRLCDEVCFHDRTQELQWLTAVWLRQAGREVEAEQWQAEADRYEEWDPFSDQQIPGHVHLWDVRVSKSGGGA